MKKNGIEDKEYNRRGLYRMIQLYEAFSDWDIYGIHLTETFMYFLRFPSNFPILINHIFLFLIWKFKNTLNICHYRIHCSHKNPPDFLWIVYTVIATNKSPLIVSTPIFLLVSTLLDNSNYKLFIISSKMRDTPPWFSAYKYRCEI